MPSIRIGNRIFEIIKTQGNPGLELVYTAKQILTADQAWEVTFAKWETIRDTCSSGNQIADGGPQTCGLCALYFYGHSEECELCPIAKAGYPGCSGSPYPDYRKAIELDSLDAASIAAQRELEFLNKIYRQMM